MDPLFNDSLFQVLGEVGTDFGGSTFGGYFGNVVFDHEFNELFKKLAEKMRPMVYELGFLK